MLVVHMAECTPRLGKRLMVLILMSAIDNHMTAGHRAHLSATAADEVLLEVWGILTAQHNLACSGASRTLNLQHSKRDRTAPNLPDCLTPPILN
jgi:hypothetical protein